MPILHPIVPTEAPELVHQKSLRIMLVDKGISVVYRWPKNQTKPAKVTVKVTLKHNPRHTLKKLKNIINSNRFRRDLRQAAQHRVCPRYQEGSQVRFRCCCRSLCRYQQLRP
uniref:60S ribosomal protein L28 n=1 Tax=Culex pipiens TaxID=7175 RepID=A0A8D8BT45_CULPI